MPTGTWHACTVLYGNAVVASMTLVQAAISVGISHPWGPVSKSDVQIFF